LAYTSNIEPLARAHCKLALFLFHQTKYQVKLNNKVMELIDINLPPHTKPLAVATLDHPNKKQCHVNGSMKFKYAMYVNDGQTAITNTTPEGMACMVTSSVKSAYLLLGYPGPGALEATPRPFDSTGP
jgi:hypothetical protein